MCEAIRLYVEREEQVEQGRVEARERPARYDATGEFVAERHPGTAPWGVGVARAGDPR